MRAVGYGIRLRHIEREAPRPTIAVGRVEPGVSGPKVPSGLTTIGSLIAVGMILSPPSISSRRYRLARTAGHADVGNVSMVTVALPGVEITHASFAAARAWQARQRGTALAAWAVLAVTFAFAITASIGFAAVNVTDVTLARASRTLWTLIPGSRAMSLLIGPRMSQH
jgi:hypothetical protein